MDVVTPALQARLVMCAAGGDIPPQSVLRWLPPGTTIAQVQAIGVVYQRQPGRAWEMAHALVAAVLV